MIGLVKAKISEQAGIKKSLISANNNIVLGSIVYIRLGNKIKTYTIVDYVPDNFLGFNNIILKDKEGDKISISEIYIRDFFRNSAMGAVGGEAFNYWSSFSEKFLQNSKKI